MNLALTDISFSLASQLHMLKINEEFVKLPFVVLIIRKVTNMTGDIPYELQFTLSFHQINCTWKSVVEMDKTNCYTGSLLSALLGSP